MDKSENIREAEFVDENGKKHTKRLFRSEENKVIAGICGGIAEYFNIDAVIVRLAWLFATVLGGGAPGILVYIIALFIIPKRPNNI